MAVLKIKNQNNEWETLIGLSGTTDYNDLKNKPTIPDELSDLQDDSSHRTVTDTEKNNWNGKYAKPNGGIPKTDLTEAVQTSLGKADSAVQDLSPITDLIPSEATSSNQLADKNFVNSSISTATATFRGTYNLVSDLALPTTATESDISTALNTAVSTKDNNDYCFVQIPTDASTPTEISRIDRYKYDSTAWSYEYSLNNSGFTASQWAAINSGITSSLVTSFGNKYDKPNGGIPYADLNSAVQTSLDNADTALQSQIQADWEESNVSSAAYIQNKPVIPEAQIQSDWNQSDNTQKDFIKNKPTDVGDFTNNAGFITKVVNDLTNYYLKNEVYTKTEINTLIQGISQFTYQVVSTLPTASADTMRIIYLTPSSSPQTQNVKDEYITIDNGELAETRYTWEQIGSTSINLTNYYTKSETDTAIATELLDYTPTSNLATVATSGDYDDLTNKPSIPAAQVNSDWDSNSGVSQILNKPTIPSITFRQW